MLRRSLCTVLSLPLIFCASCSASWTDSGPEGDSRVEEEDIVIPARSARISTEAEPVAAVTSPVASRLPKVRVADKTDVEKRSRFSLNRPPDVQALLRSEEAPPDANDLSALVDDWFYGQGVGETVVNIGTVVLMPFYAIYLVGNAGAELAGYERLSPFNSLPADAVEPFAVIYDGVTSAPGYVASLFSGEEFKGGESARTIVSKNRREQEAREREEILRVVGGETEAIRANDRE